MPIILLIFFYFIAITTLSAHTPHTKTIIVDTEGKHAYYYDTLCKIAERCTFSCDYKNLYNLLENPIIESCYDAAFIFISNKMLHNPHHPITQDVMHAIIPFTQKKNHLTLFFLPSNAPIDAIASFLSTISLPSNINPYSAAQLYLYRIGIPNAQSGHIIGTSLFNAQPTKKTSRATIQKIPSNVLFLPCKQTESYPQNLIHPFAVSFYDHKKKNIIALAPSLDITFADIAENFHKNPHDINIRDQLLAHAQQAIWELSQLHVHHTIINTPCPPLAPSLCMHPIIKKRKPFNAAWLDPKDFYLHEMAHCATPEQKEQALIQGCAFLLESDIDLLWFEINPEWYFSPRTLFKKDTDAVMGIMQKIGRTLMQNNRQKTPPRLFIGSDITSNFNGQKPPHNSSDIWGTEYPNVPCCFDIENVWQMEVIDPFKKTYELLRSIIPIKGLFLDFEMYHAPHQASSYHDLMDFSSYTWNLFRQTYRETPDLLTTHDRVQYLKTHKLLNLYVLFLEKQAENIGIFLRENIQKIDPTLQITTYAPTLPSSWFYRGILRGLSTKEFPSICATFNVDYVRHKKWLTEQNIHIIHGTAYMLSKLTAKKDTAFLKHLNRHHDFIWYNRPSRQLYSLVGLTPQSPWWIAEWSPMDTKKLSKKIGTKY